MCLPSVSDPKVIDAICTASFEARSFYRRTVSYDLSLVDVGGHWRIGLATLGAFRARAAVLIPPDGSAGVIFLNVQADGWRYNEIRATMNRLYANLAILRSGSRRSQAAIAIFNKFQAKP